MWNLPEPGLNPCPLHWQVDSYPLSHQGSPIHFSLYNSITFSKCTKLWNHHHNLILEAFHHARKQTNKQTNKHLIPIYLQSLLVSTSGSRPPPSTFIYPSTTSTLSYPNSTTQAVKVLEARIPLLLFMEVSVKEWNVFSPSRCLGKTIALYEARNTNSQIYIYHFFFPNSSSLFTYFSFIFISWRLITLQYCSGFCHTLTLLSHGFTCIPHPDPPSHLPLYPIPLGLPSAPGLSTCFMHPTWAGDLFHPR